MRMRLISSNIIEIQVFHRRTSHPLFLMLRYSENGNYAGNWTVLTGSVPEDELPVNAALQTLVEMTALSPIAIWALDYIHSYYDPIMDTIHFNPIFAIEVSNDKLTLDAEYNASRWITAEQAMGLLRWPGHREGLRRAAEDVVFAADRGKAFRINPHAS